MLNLENLGYPFIRGKDTIFPLVHDQLYSMMLVILEYGEYFLCGDCLVKCFLSMFTHGAFSLTLDVYYTRSLVCKMLCITL